MPIRTIAVVILFATAFVSSLAMEAAPAGGFDADKLLNVRSALQSAITDRQMSGVVTAVWRNGELAQLNALAYDRYALDAFEANSIDYLLKPVEPDRLQRALDKVERMVGRAHAPDRERQLRGDVQALARELAAQLTPQRAPDRIASQAGERVVLLDLARVTHFVSRDKLTFAIVNGREHVIDRTLADLEATLDERRFVRIHRATIVNIAAVHEIDRWIDGGVLVRLKDEKKTELPVARDRVREFKRRLRF
jgi:two-component system LytT family response regulator